MEAKIETKYLLIAICCIVCACGNPLMEQLLQPLMGDHVPLELVWIPPGTFTMGSPLDEIGRWIHEGPQHSVTLTQGFYMGKYPVTQGQWEAVMKDNTNGISPNPSSFSAAPVYGEVQVRRPVECVSWYDVIVFCNRLSLMEGLSPAYCISGSTNPDDWFTVPTSSPNATWDAVSIVPGSKGYRLPTEAQWEYACRAGTVTAYSYGDIANGDYMWSRENSYSRTREVGRKLPNAWGLYDMHGNVFEWCYWWYWEYSSGTQTDPSGPTSGAMGVFRGGSWRNFAVDHRSAMRRAVILSHRGVSIGFRIVRPGS